MTGRYDVPAPWPGLAFVLEHGLPGFPAPRTDDVSDEVRAARSKAGRASGAARRIEVANL